MEGICRKALGKSRGSKLTGNVIEKVAMVKKKCFRITFLNASLSSSLSRIEDHAAEMGLIFD